VSPPLSGSAPANATDHFGSTSIQLWPWHTTPSKPLHTRPTSRRTLDTPSPILPLPHQRIPTIIDIMIQPLQRALDYYIMDEAVHCSGLLPSEIRWINYCRLYLKIVTVSNMTNVTSNQLASGIRQGLHLWSQSKSKLQEIHQERPNEASWTIWRRFLNTFSNFHGYLFQPLAHGSTLPLSFDAPGHLSYHYPATPSMYDPVISMTSNPWCGPAYINMTPS
jgi:hypothetical protein